MNFTLKISKKSKGSKKRVFLAPLDWGLGHVTRCVALAKILYDENYEVYWGLSNSLAKKLVSQYFPKAIILEINSYNVEYAKKGKNFLRKLMWQFPKIIQAVQKEHHYLKKWHEKYEFDLVISDNRYGLYHSDIKTIFLTHQVYPLSGKNQFLDVIVAYLHQQWLKRYAQIWKFDDPDGQLAGKLSWAQKDAYPAIGIASQLSLVEDSTKYVPPPFKEKPHLLILLSGPEPQRSLLEQAILKEMDSLSSYQITLVRGTDRFSLKFSSTSSLNIIDFTTADQLYKLIQSAELVISRSGYSTLMDMVILNKRMLLIPTPGQTEQIYLAQYFSEKNWAVSTDQDHLNLVDNIEMALKLAPSFKVSLLNKDLILDLIKD